VHVTLQEQEVALHRREQHDRLVQFLEDQQNLDELLKIPADKAVVHDNVLILTGERGKIDIGDGSRVDSFVKLECGLGMRIGRFVHIASFAHLGIGGGETVIEDFAAVASGARVISGSNSVEALTMSACAPPELQRVERKRTVIGKYAVVLTNAVVLPGVTLHEGAVLAAGGVATKDIPAWEIWAGVPAKFLAKRVLR
jgi:acetyltransferase-like isoleucine patch superfamily enzyme